MEESRKRIERAKSRSKNVTIRKTTTLQQFYPMESYITKQGGSVKNWKERYLVNENDQLVYYVNSEKKKKKGSIEVKTITKVEFVGELDSRPYVFAILTSSGKDEAGRTFYISTSSQQLSMDWINVISKIISVGDDIHNTKSAGQTIKIRVGYDYAETFQQHVFVYAPDETLSSLFSKIEKKREISAETHVFRDEKGFDLSLDLTQKEIPNEIFLVKKSDVPPNSAAKNYENGTPTLAHSDFAKTLSFSDVGVSPIQKSSSLNKVSQSPATVLKNSGLNINVTPQAAPSPTLSRTSSVPPGSTPPRLSLAQLAIFPSPSENETPVLNQSQEISNVTDSAESDSKQSSIVESSEMEPAIKADVEHFNMIQMPLTSLQLRDKCVREIYDTEISYVAGLSTLVKSWISPLKEKKLITNEEAKELFSNVESILEFSKSQLAKKLQERLEDWHSEQKIGDVVTSLTPFMRIYKTYCDNYENALATLSKISKKKNVAAFLKEAEVQCKGFSCSYYLIMPVQRVPRYQMLLKEVINKTAKEHPDYENLNKAKNEITQLALEVNESVQQSERSRAMGELMATGLFVGLDEIVAPHRQLIIRSQAYAKSSDGTACKFVLLFTDLCVLATVDFKKNREIYIIKDKIPLGAVWITSDPSDELLKIKTPENSNVVIEKKNKENPKSPDWEVELKKQIISWLLSSANDPQEVAVNTSIIKDENDDADIRYTRYVYKDGSQHVGFWQRGQPHGEGTLTTATGIKISGMFYKGLCEGKAKISYPNGDEYEGSVSLNLPHGAGIFTSANKITYKGDWVKGFQKGNAEVTFPDGSKYVGQYDSNFMHGNGILEGPPSKNKVDPEFIYDGQFAKDMKNGIGTLTTPCLRYKGEWKNNFYHGQGKEEIFPDQVYEGSFVMGMKSGEGTLTKGTPPNQIIYKGCWENNLYHGTGTLTSGNYSYSGEWKNGKKNGEGNLKTGHVQYVGQWKDNLYDGEGKWGCEGEKYEGSFKNGLKHGKGKMTFATGDCYEGEWELDMPTGKGTYSFKYTKATLKGDWDLGLPHGTAQLNNPDKETYDGSWEHGKRNGEGVLKQSLSTYIGAFKNGLKEGKGSEEVDHWSLHGFWHEGNKNGSFQVMENQNLPQMVSYNEGVRQASSGTFFHLPDAPELPTLEYTFLM
eukprot:TRINITY_DN15689_c0_g1_i1.p1 TRINITY_DN15689_c0_g1~~TRINITY_DN15689_c0_g1_i1.p1  ORF type:complete len:1158 (+),score=339.10 TRINITY_DN15689_c0_g1_i1:16-3489(+)